MILIQPVFRLHVIKHQKEKTKVLMITKETLVLLRAYYGRGAYASLENHKLLPETRRMPRGRAWQAERGE